MQSFVHQLNNLSKMGMIISVGEQYSLASLIKKADEIRQQYPKLYQSSVAISYTNLAEFITALLAFDGWCSAIYLCPPNVSLPQKNIKLWPLDTQHIVTDSNQSAQLANATQTIWYMATSGTTGEPKWFSHSFDSLTTSTKYSNKLQSVTWGLLYQPFRFAGLQVLLQALLSGADLIDVVDCEPLTQMRLLKQGHVTAISATPSLWRQLLMTGQLSELALSNITLGGEITDQTVLEQLKRLFPEAKIRHIYASTEAGVGFVVSDGLAGFPVTWLEETSGLVSLKVSKQQHLLVKPNPQVCQMLSVQTDSEGYLDTLDKVEIIADRVHFIGRATGTINVGGNKVHPEKVEQVILQCAKINQVKVYAKKSAMMGELVVADVTVHHTNDPQSVKQQVLELCKNKLQRFEIPFKINIVSHIAHNASGKLKRHSNRDQQHD